MITKSVIAESLQDLKLNGSLNYFIDHYDEMIQDEKTSLEILNELLVAEKNTIGNRKILALINKSNIRYPTSILTEIDCSNKKGITRDVLQGLADCNWIKSKQNLIFTGATGIGKTWLASAFGTNACKLNYKVLFYNAIDLFEQFNTASNLGTITTLKKKLLSSDLLILDDFGLSPINTSCSWMTQFMDVIDKHSDKGSLIITSQYETHLWSNRFEDRTIGEGILDRTIHRSHIFNLEGESMRKRIGKSIL